MLITRYIVLYSIILHLLNEEISCKQLEDSYQNVNTCQVQSLVKVPTGKIKYLYASACLFKGGIKVFKIHKIVLAINY